MCLAFLAGGPPATPPIAYNPQNGQYNGGVPTNFGSFRPKY